MTSWRQKFRFARERGKIAKFNRSIRACTTIHLKQNFSRKILPCGMVPLDWGFSNLRPSTWYIQNSTYRPEKWNLHQSKQNPSYFYIIPFSLDCCHNDADHYWPLDKVSNNRVYDSKTKIYSQVSGSVTMNKVGPPLEFGNRTSLILSDGYIDLYSPTSGLYDETFSTQGFSVALWLKIESLSNTASYYLSGGKANQGFSIYSPLEAGIWRWMT